MFPRCSVQRSQACFEYKDGHVHLPSAPFLPNPTCDRPGSTERLAEKSGAVHICDAAQDPRRTAGKLAYMYEYQEDYRVFYKYIPRQVVDRCLVVVIYPSQTSASASSIWPRLRRRRASSIPVLRPRDLRPHNGIRRSPAHHLWALLACRLACPLQHRRTRSRQYTLTSLRAQETSASTAMAERRCRLNSLREILYLLDGREDQDIQL